MLPSHGGASVLWKLLLLPTYFAMCVSWLLKRESVFLGVFYIVQSASGVMMATFVCICHVLGHIHSHCLLVPLPLPLGFYFQACVCVSAF